MFLYWLCFLDQYEVLFSDGFAKVQQGSKLFKATEEDLKNYEVSYKLQVRSSYKYMAVWEITSSLLVSSNY